MSKKKVTKADLEEEDQTPKGKKAAVAKKKKKAKGHGFLKFYALLMLAVFAVGFFVPKYFDLGTTALVDGSLLGVDGMLFNHVLDLVQKAMAGTIVLDMHVWMIAAAAVLFVLSTLLTLFTRKSAPRHFLFGAALTFVLIFPYALSVFDLNAIKIDFFMVTAVLALLGLFVEGLAYGKGKNFLPFLSLVVLSAALYVTYNYNFFAEANGLPLSTTAHDYIVDTVVDVLGGGAFAVPADTYVFVSHILFVVLFLAQLFTALQIALVRKTTGFSAFRYFLLLAVAVAAAVMTYLAKNPADLVNDMFGFIVVAGASLVLFIFALIGKPKNKAKAAKKKAKKAAQKAKKAVKEDDEDED